MTCDRLTNGNLCKGCKTQCYRWFFGLDGREFIFHDHIFAALHFTNSAAWRAALPCRIFCCFFIHPTAAPRGAPACAPGPVMLGSVFRICDFEKAFKSSVNEWFRSVVFRFWVTHCRCHEDFRGAIQERLNSIARPLQRPCNFILSRFCLIYKECVLRDGLWPLKNC